MIRSQDDLASYLLVAEQFPMPIALLSADVKAAFVTSLQFGKYGLASFQQLEQAL